MLEVYGRRGRVDDAVALIDEAVAMLGDVWQEEWFLGRIRLSALGVTALLGRRARRAAEAARAALVERAGALVADGRTAEREGPADGRPLGVEARGLAARLEAEWARLRWLAGIDAPAEDEHVAAWHAAVAAFDYGNVVELARGRARLAAVLRAAGRTRRGGRAGRPRPRRRPGDARRAAAGRDPRAGPGAPRRGAAAPAGLDALTDREREVLACWSTARTNRQIAGQLYISEKTVSVHVSNILAKLGRRAAAPRPPPSPAATRAG